MSMIVGIAGRKYHGKDTAAQALEGYENVKFAGPLKAMIRAFMEYLGISAETIDRCIDGDMKETPMACFGGKTTRFLMKTIGTEWGRDLIWQDLWVHAAKMRAEQFDKVVITDMRFPNEVDAVKEMGGTTLRVVRPNFGDTSDVHPSEALVDTLQVDHVIPNIGSVEELHSNVRRVLAQPRIPGLNPRWDVV